MRARISVITLGVSDMARAIAFYRDGLSLPIRDDKPPVAYFELEGTWLALLPADALGRYIGLEAAYPAGSFAPGPGAVSLSVNVDSRTDVDATMAKAEAAGARIVSAAHEFRWGGYAGWFADPDEHLWEIVWNPRPFMD